MENWYVFYVAKRGFPDFLTLTVFSLVGFAENVLVKGPPSEAEWWGEESSSPEEVSCSTEKDSSSDESSRRFQNCGYHAWKRARSEWRRETVEKRPSRPPPVRRDQVARGLRQSARQYELPGRMKLKDVVTIYAADIWDLDPEDMW